MQGKPITLYIVMHNSTEEGETPTFKLEKLVTFSMPYVSAQHIFRGLKDLVELLITRKEIQNASISGKSIERIIKEAIAGDGEGIN